MLYPLSYGGSCMDAAAARRGLVSLDSIIGALVGVPVSRDAESSERSAKVRPRRKRRSAAKISRRG